MQHIQQSTVIFNNIFPIFLSYAGINKQGKQKFSGGDPAISSVWIIWSQLRLRETARYTCCNLPPDAHTLSLGFHFGQVTQFGLQVLGDPLHFVHSLLF